ncbi:MAG TPA: PrgI family protein [Candidatus Paceibacterota bacterium]
MRFQVPQFIEVEDKIFGPFTFKQFIYLAGGAGMIVIAFSLLPKFFAFMAAVPIAALSLALTFYRVNNRPFISILEAFFKYFTSKKLFIWKTGTREDKKQLITDNKQERQISVPKLSQSKLRELTWNLSVRGSSAPSAPNESEENINQRT